MADVTISQLSTGTPNSNAVIPFSQGSSTLKTSPSGIVAASPGSILQAIQGIKRDNLTETQINYPSTPTWYSIPGLSARIIPKSVNSKILVMTQISINIQYNHPSFRTTRNGSPVYVNTQPVAGTMGPIYGTAQASAISLNGISGNSAPTTSYFFVDDPQTTSEVIYQAQFIFQPDGSAGRTVTINRAFGADGNGQQATSNVVLLEIAG